MHSWMVPLFSLVFASVSVAGEVSPRVIYGDDNRKNLYEVNDSRLLQLADSTVAVFSNSDILEKPNGNFSIRTVQYGKSLNLCPTEKFYDEPISAFCSGFLLGPDIVVTAGHCIRNEDKCDDTSFVFGFAISKSGEYPKEVGPENVYRCKTVIKSQVLTTGSDFSIVQLDRPVTNHMPLNFRREGNPEVGDSITVIGHPSGLPTKISDGAKVRGLRMGYFITNLDTYGGNSGSAVFNDTTGEVEGILVRGETDFVARNGCSVSNVCSESGCQGEDVTLISELTRFLPRN